MSIRLGSRGTTALALALLVLTAGCLAPLQATADGTDGDDATTISVTGTGSVSTEADLAVVHVSVVATADTADTARELVASDSQRMRAALRDAGVADDAVTTAFFSINPEYNFERDRRELVGYRAVHAFRIEVAPDRAGDVIDVTVGNGADEVDGVSFTLTDETRADLRADALTAAVEAARADADTIADAADLEVTGVRSASTGGGFVPYEVRFAEAADAGGGASTTIESGPVTVTATVSMTFEAR